MIDSLLKLVSNSYSTNYNLLKSGVWAVIFDRFTLSLQKYYVQIVYFYFVQFHNSINVFTGNFIKSFWYPLDLLTSKIKITHSQLLIVSETHKLNDSFFQTIYSICLYPYIILFAAALLNFTINILNSLSIFFILHLMKCTKNFKFRLILRVRY